MNDSFIVKTNTFQGPLDLLLNLIEKRKLLINEISLAKITDDYLDYLNHENSVPLKMNAHFILVASTLVLIKSKSILPGIGLTEDETQSIEELETRLKIFQKIKSLEPWLTENFGKKISYHKKESETYEVIFTTSPKLTLGSITESIKNILLSFPKKEKIPYKIVKKVISLEESINNLTERIKKSINLNFKDFATINKADKFNVVVNFLAMLELVKQGTIYVVQNDEHGDIEMQTSELETPNYC